MTQTPEPSSSADHPDVSYKPPYLYAFFLTLGLLLNWVWSIEILNFWAQIAIGLVFIGAGVGTAVWAVKVLQAAGTNFRLHEPVRAFVRTGPYRFTRNPIYLGLSTTYLGISILFDAPIAMLLMVPLTAFMNKFVIAREEEFLEARFGADYRRYKEVVSRWV